MPVSERPGLDLGARMRCSRANVRLQEDNRMNDRVSVVVEDHIAKVTLIRADKMNAVDPEMKKAIVEAGG